MKLAVDDAGELVDREEALGEERQQRAEIDDADANANALRAESIRRALKATKGHRGRAAKILGISRSTLYRYCEAYGIEMGAIDRIASE